MISRKDFAGHPGRHGGDDQGHQRPFNPLYQAAKAPKAVDSAPKTTADGKAVIPQARRPRVGSYGKAGTEDHLAKHYADSGAEECTCVTCPVHSAQS
jgi:hypothetical protein